MTSQCSSFRMLSSFQMLSMLGSPNPQAQSAHNNFWDFQYLHSEATHMFMWAMSDRGIPRSYRMMQGFGVNTYTLTNSQGVRSFVKFHFTPALGVHSLVWDEALKICGQDPDFHRKDLNSAIENGAYPVWKFGIQVARRANKTISTSTFSMPQNSGRESCSLSDTLESWNSTRILTNTSPRLSKPLSAQLTSFPASDFLMTLSFKAAISPTSIHNSHAWAVNRKAHHQEGQDQLLP